MQDANSHGREAPKAKTINVELDLLAEWSSERNRLRDRSTRTLALLFALALLALVSLPPLKQAWLSANATVRAKEKQAQAALAGLAQHRTQRAQVAPRLALDELNRGTGANARAFLGQMTALMNAAGPGVAFSTMRTDVLTGEVTINVEADAVNFDAARAFAERVANMPGVKDAVRSSTRPKTTLGPSGVGFQFRVRAGVVQ